MSDTKTISIKNTINQLYNNCIMDNDLIKIFYDKSIIKDIIKDYVLSDKDIQFYKSECLKVMSHKKILKLLMFNYQYLSDLFIKMENIYEINKKMFEIIVKYVHHIFVIQKTKLSDFINYDNHRIPHPVKITPVNDTSIDVLINEIKNNLIAKKIMSIYLQRLKIAELKKQQECLQFYKLIYCNDMKIFLDRSDSKSDKDYCNQYTLIDSEYDYSKKYSKKYSRKYSKKNPNVKKYNRKKTVEMYNRSKQKIE